MPKKRHHFRPVLHLKHFAGRDGLVWVFDKSGDAPSFAQKPENIGYEKGLYSIQSGPNAATDAFEDWLAEHIDRPAARPLAKASIAEPLTHEERFRLATFFAAQDLRTPLSRNHLLGKFAGDVDDLWKRWKANPEALVEDIFRDSGKRYSAAELLEDLHAYEATPTNDFWLGFIQSVVHKAAKLLHGMSWNHGYAPPGTPFVTTDIGIAKGVDDSKNLVPWAPGIQGRRNHWIIPLTPGSALMLEPSGAGMTGSLRGSWVVQVNQRLKADAARWVYSRDRPPAR